VIEVNHSLLQPARLICRHHLRRQRTPGKRRNAIEVRVREEQAEALPAYQAGSSAEKNRTSHCYIMGSRTAECQPEDARRALDS
jgi:hypothetical protein